MEQNERQLDRRQKTRFPLKCELLYKVLAGKTVVAQGAGITLDISSKGVSFRLAQTPEPIRPGEFIELSISWPARLGNEIPLRLVTIGKVVRSMGGWVACVLGRHEFRTQARVLKMPGALPIGPPPAPQLVTAEGRVIPAAQPRNRRSAHA